MTIQLDTAQIAKTQSFLSRYGKVDCNFNDTGVHLVVFTRDAISIQVIFDGEGEPIIALNNIRKPFDPMTALSDDFNGRGNPQSVIEDWIENNL